MDGLRGEAGITLIADYVYKIGWFLDWYYNGFCERNGGSDSVRIVSGKDIRYSVISRIEDTFQFIITETIRYIILTNFRDNWQINILTG